MVTYMALPRPDLWRHPRANGRPAAPVHGAPVFVLAVVIACSVPVDTDLLLGLTLRGAVLVCAASVQAFGQPDHKIGDIGNYKVGRLDSSLHVLYSRRGCDAFSTSSMETLWTEASTAWRSVYCLRSSNLLGLLSIRPLALAAGHFAAVCAQASLSGTHLPRSRYARPLLCFAYGPSPIIPLVGAGNHEDRTTNTVYGFAHECKERFARGGEEVWHKINEVFAYLPLAARVDGKILCVHGGIGRVTRYAVFPSAAVSVASRLLFAVTLRQTDEAALACLQAVADCCDQATSGPRLPGT